MEAGTLDDIQFNGIFDWFLHIYPIGPLWNNQPTYLVAQASFSLGAALTLLHALRAGAGGGGGGRLRYLWPATVLHGLVVESLCYISPDVDNFWHSQTPIILLGRRLPLHILFLYPCFIYQASVAAAHLKLPKWAEPFAVGLLVVMIDMPYDITSVKFVHWTWHDTDPNIADRHYWVPWNSYYFHLTFATSFSFWFHAVRRWLDPQTPKWQSSSADKELVSMILAAVLGPVGGVMMFLPLYHPLHDLFHIHSEVTFFILLSVALLVVWTGERRFSVKQPDILFDGCRLLTVALVVHYAVYLGLVCLGHPEREVSVGFHEPLGPCNLTHPVYTLTGILKRDKFLCIDNYDEAYFDFHCVPEPPKGLAKWYTICGTPFENRPEYIAVISIINLVAFVVFWNIYYNPYQATISEKQAKQVHKYKSH